MKELEIILSLSGTAAGLLVTTVTFILKFIRSTKAKRLADQLTAIGEAVVPYIEQAEGFLHYSGAEKKEFVLTKANQFAIGKGYDFNVPLVAERIEELVRLTKKVNARDRDLQSVPRFHQNAAL